MGDATCSVPGCASSTHCKGLCQPHYMRFWRYGDPEHGGPLRVRVRATLPNFWALIDKTGPLIAGHPERGPCWLWTGRIDNGGYGVFGTVGRVGQRAHRFSWMLANNREFPEGMEADHLCHTLDLSCPGGVCGHRRCVNPQHLEPVTHHENAMRSVRARTNTCHAGHPLVVVGERNGRPRRGCPTCKEAVRLARRDECAALSGHVGRHEPQRLTPEFMRELADVYQHAAETGDSPRLAVARHCGRSPSTVADWIRAIRKAGVLPPYDPAA